MNTVILNLKSLQQSLNHRNKIFRRNMLFLNFYKFVCMPCLRIFSSYSKKYSYSTQLYKEVPPKPVPLAFSEYLIDEKDNIIDQPIFILHGLLGSRNNWNTVAKAMAAVTRRKVVALDLRNHGDSPHTNDFSYPHMVEDLKHLMLEQKVEEGKASIIGHSIGGRVAMALALDNPKAIKDLVIVDISPLGIIPGTSYVPRLLDAIDSVKLTPGQSLINARKEANEQMKKYIRGEKLRSWLITNLIIDGETKNFVWKINTKAVRMNFSSLLAFPKFDNIFEGPCLFIGGGKSDYLKKEDEEGIKKLFPKATFEHVSGAGHLVHSDKPNLFLEIVSNFFEKHVPPD